MEDDEEKVPTQNVPKYGGHLSNYKATSTTKHLSPGTSSSTARGRPIPFAHKRGRGK